MPNFKIIIEYNGSEYHGWQRQKNEKTVQGEIEEAIKKITGKKASVIGSGRTDAGVHAFGQVANFFCETNVIEPLSLKKALNSVLTGDIIIHECAIAESDFHARYDAKSKVYNYVILNRETGTAIFRNRCWIIKKKLNVENMKKAASILIGTHDFKSFEGSDDSPKMTSIRTVFNSNVVKNEDYIIYEIEAEGFLKHMVRNIIGTLVDVGLNKISTKDFSNILAFKDRTKAGVTAPSFGLFLMNVRYDENNSNTRS